ncbi:hypothetical protein [Brevundimonas sp. R86498]|uniref:hypothetical protein n=1 Tax=Brevundimonas sp. R86498 TaxID=3093845 RepID=UPI0037C929BD
MKALVVISAAIVSMGVSACQTLPIPGQNARLEREIGQIETRVMVVENAIDAATSPISTTEQAIRTKVRYRPILAWAESFSSGPAAGRTITFRQTSKNGNIDQRSHECRVPFGPYHDGWEARIHEENSTRANVTIDRFIVEPLVDGLQMTAPLTFHLSTQVEGSYRPACAGWLPSVNLGVTGEATPTAVFRLLLAGGDDSGQLHYRLQLVSPASVGLEMRAHFPRFRVGFTIPVRGLADRLADGEVDLLFSRHGEIRLPDGQVMGYRLDAVEPRVATDIAGIQFTSNLNLVIAGEATPVE